MSHDYAEPTCIQALMTQWKKDKENDLALDRAMQKTRPIGPNRAERRRMAKRGMS